MVAYCDTCDTFATFISIATHVVGPDENDPAREFTFARCAECDNPGLLARDDFGDAYSDYAMVFPPKKRQIRFRVPSIVRQSYDEAAKCETGKAWTACAAMIGRALEAVCKDHEPKSPTMFAALKAMVKDGVISQEVYDWADALRVIRNASAHATESKVSRDDAVEAFDFLQSIIEIIYDLRPRFTKMRARHAKP